MVSRSWPLIPTTCCSLRIGSKTPRDVFVALHTTILSTHAYVQTTACFYLERHNRAPFLDAKRPR
jgi:spore maturation protein SpmA